MLIRYKIKCFRYKLCFLATISTHAESHALLKSIEIYKNLLHFFTSYQLIICNFTQKLGCASSKNLLTSFFNLFALLSSKEVR